MILRFIRENSERKQRAQQLYGSIVAQARREEFYRSWNVPDTINGRFDMIVLHLFLLVQRLKMNGEEGKQAARLVIEAFFRDMDNSVREQGAGDLAVAKHVRRMADAMYGRFSSYQAAVRDGRNDLLVNALARNFFPDQDPDCNGPERQAAEMVALYMMEAHNGIRTLSFEEVLAGAIDFPDILSFAGESGKYRS